MDVIKGVSTLHAHLFALFAILDPVSRLGVLLMHLYSTVIARDRWLSLARNLLVWLLGVGRCIHGLEGGEGCFEKAMVSCLTAHVFRVWCVATVSDLPVRVIGGGLSFRTVAMYM